SNATTSRPSQSASRSNTSLSLSATRLTISIGVKGRRSESRRSDHPPTFDLGTCDVQTSSGAGGADGLDGAGEGVDGGVHLGLRRRAAEREADGGEGLLAREAHRREDVARLGRLHLARAAGGGGHVAQRREQL